MRLHWSRNQYADISVHDIVQKSSEIPHKRRGIAPVQPITEPHIHDYRISVRQEYAIVEERREDPVALTDRYSLDVVDVYHGTLT